MTALRLQPIVQPASLVRLAAASPLALQPASTAPPQALVPLPRDLPPLVQAAHLSRPGGYCMRK